MTDALAPIEIRPQPGPQSSFLSTPADIAIYGGAAYGGKTYALVLEPLRWRFMKGFSCVVFRRTYPEIMNPGGLWDTSSEVYPHFGGVARESKCEWYFPDTDVTIKFTHMQHEKDKLTWQGSALPLICWDELTHFSRSQFMYLLSRNRLQIPLKMRPYIRATCNPDSASWVSDFISWWIDEDTGFPISERAGKMRWMVRNGEKIVWADTKEELDLFGSNPKSVTFIPAKITDNKIGMDQDPDYLGNLQALSLFEREQLLHGNWKVRPSSGMIFKRAWFKVTQEAPAEGRTLRYWDRAATEVTSASTDPDWTVGLKMRVNNGVYYVLDVCSGRWNPAHVQRMMRNCADQDGEDCEVWAEQEPGSSGVADVMTLSHLFGDRVFKVSRPTQDKVTRALPASAASEIGNVVLVGGRWNESFLQQVDMFADWKQVDTKPEKLPHDDEVDAFTGAYNALACGGTPKVSR